MRRATAHQTLRLRGSYSEEELVPSCTLTKANKEHELALIITNTISERERFNTVNLGKSVFLFLVIVVPKLRTTKDAKNRKDIAAGQTQFGGNKEWKESYPQISQISTDFDCGKINL